MRQGKIGSVEPLVSGAVARHASGRLTIATPGRVSRISPGRWRSSCGQRHPGRLVTLFCRHTSASLTIQENADPDVQTDLMTALDGFAPRGAPYVHGAEGPDDMPAHIRTLVTDSALNIPLVEGRLALGTWQGIYLIEHRDRPHRREIVVSVIGA